MGDKIMIKLFIGSKGSGKTKTLIELVNTATEKSNGSVVCIEKGDKLTHDVTYKARLVDTNDYNIDSTIAFYGFIAGILASNNDITDVFVDSALKICGDKADEFSAILPALEKIAKDINLVMTLSIAVEDCPLQIKAYV
jgi:hypothetical protein